MSRKEKPFLCVLTDGSLIGPVEDLSALEEKLKEGFTGTATVYRKVGEAFPLVDLIIEEGPEGNGGESASTVEEAQSGDR